MSWISRSLTLPVLLVGALAGQGCAESQCSFNSDCPAGRCTDGECVRECFASIDCPNKAAQCLRGICELPEGDAAVDTSTPTDTDVVTDTTVISDIATDTTPVDTTTPSTDTPAGTKGYLTKCAGDGDCASAKCAPGSPRFCTKTCSAHADCAHGQLCAGGICRLDDTGQTGCDLTSGAPCMEFCYGNATAKHCTHSCSAGADCPAGFACSPVSAGKKVCVEIERACSDATQCVSGLGFCGGVGCTGTCDTASDCPQRLVGLPAYTCELRSGQKVCVAPSDILGADPIGSSCPATGTNKCRSGACDPGTTPPQCVQRCSTRGGCPPSWGCFPLEDPGPPKTALLVCSAAGTLWLGDACTRGRDCSTGICQAPGYCTRLCVDGLCPDGMSCITAPLTADDGTPIKLCTK